MAKTSIIAKLTFKPGRRQEAVDAFGPMFEAVNDEDGTEVYIMCLDDSDENVVWTYEIYSSFEARDAHNGSPAMADMFGALGDLVSAAPEINTLTPTMAKGVPI